MPVNMPADDDELHAARDAYSRGDWRAAYDLFGRAQETELTTDDLSSYGMAAWRLGHGRQSMQLSEQAFNRSMSAGEPHNAAMKAVEVALQWFNGGDLTIARVWLNRARRLHDKDPDDQILAYVLYVDSLVAIDEGRNEVSRRARRGASRSLTTDQLPRIQRIVLHGQRRVDDSLRPHQRSLRPVRRGDDAGAGRPSPGGLGRRHLLRRDLRMSSARGSQPHEDMVRSHGAVAHGASRSRASWYGTTCEFHKMDLHSATKDYRQVEERLINALTAMGDFPGDGGQGLLRTRRDTPQAGQHRRRPRGLRQGAGAQP